MPVEKFIQINASDKSITAFVQKKFVTEEEESNRGIVQVLVRNVEAKDILLWIFGKVLSQSNPVRVDKNWVRENVLLLR